MGEAAGGEPRPAIKGIAPTRQRVPMDSVDIYRGEDGRPSETLAKRSCSRCRVVSVSRGAQLFEPECGV